MSYHARGLSHRLPWPTLSTPSPQSQDSLANLTLVTLVRQHHITIPRPRITLFLTASAAKQELHRTYRRGETHSFIRDKQKNLVRLDLAIMLRAYS